MRWMWIDRVIELIPGERLVAVKNISLAEDHLHDHFAATAADEQSPAMPAMPIMPASLILEGMAQSAGILVGHSEDFKEKVILAKIARATLDRDATAGMTLRYTATLMRKEAQGASTTGCIDCLDHSQPDLGYQPFGKVDMLFSHLDQNMAGMDFPAHNFVFGENFKTLLRSSGIDFDD